MVTIVVLIVALILFLLAAFGVNAGRVSLLALGFVFLTLAFLLPAIGVH